MKQTALRYWIFGMISALVLVLSYFWWKSDEEKDTHSGTSEKHLATSTSINEAKTSMAKLTMDAASLSITGIKNGDIHVTNTLIIKNPLPDPLDLTGLDYAVFMNSLKIAEGRYSKPIRLPASGSITIDLPLVIAASTADAIGDKLETYGQDSVMYTFMNTIHTGLPIAGEKKFQVKMQEFLPVILPVMKPPHSDIKK